MSLYMLPVWSKRSDPLRQPFQIGQEQAERCRFDHTSRGSFWHYHKVSSSQCWTIIPAGFESPLERRVVERITRGLLSVQMARENATTRGDQ